MDSEIIKSVAENTGQVSGTMIVLIVFCVGWLLERIWKITRAQKNGNPDIQIKLDNKVNADECKSFKTRIGKESDEHRQNISDIKNGISTIKADIGYIKGKIG